MTLKMLRFVYFCSLISCLTINIEASQEPPLLLVVAYDGLRYDFVNAIKTPNLWQLVAKQGVWSPKGIKNQMITLTAPTFQTMVTGLYQESHGIIGNKFYDPVFNEVYDYWNHENESLHNASLDSKWYSGEPIWQTNDKNGKGRKSGAMRWPLCDADMNNIEMKYCKPWEDFRDFSQWKDDLDELLSWFVRKDDPINLGLYYISEPDHTEHENDIYSEVVRLKIAELDVLTGYMIQRLKKLELWDKINIIFTSDHGHANVFTRHNIVKFDDYIDKNEYIWSAKSVFPAKKSNMTVKQLFDRINEIRMAFPIFEMWLKEDVPKEFHYKNNRRIGPIVLMEHLGYVIISHLDTNSADLPPQAKLELWGNHGYSNEYSEMRPFFTAIGPAFRSEYVMNDEFENIDLYNMMCYILEINPVPNDGNIKRVLSMFNEDQKSKFSRSFVARSTLLMKSHGTGNVMKVMKIFTFTLPLLVLIIFKT